METILIHIVRIANASIECRCECKWKITKCQCGTRVRMKDRRANVASIKSLKFLNEIINRILGAVVVVGRLDFVGNRTLCVINEPRVYLQRDIFSEQMSITFRIPSTSRRINLLRSPLKCENFQLKLLRIIAGGARWYALISIHNQHSAQFRAI